MIVNPFTLNQSSGDNKIKISVFDADYRNYRFSLDSNYIAFSIAYTYSKNQSCYTVSSPIIVRNIVNLSGTYLDVAIQCISDSIVYVGDVSGTTIIFDKNSTRTYYITQFLS